MNCTVKLKYSELFVNKGILLVGSSPPSKFRNLGFKTCTASCNSLLFYFSPLNSVPVLQLIKRQWHLSLRHFCENLSLLTDEVFDRIHTLWTAVVRYRTYSGWILWKMERSFRFRKTWLISWPNVRLLASQYGLCSLQLVAQSVVTKSVIKKKELYKANFLSVRFGQLQR